MWNGKLKAITISSDDGVLQDKKFVQLIEKYNICCTFNINSGMMYNDCVWISKNVEIRRMTAEQCLNILSNKDIAAHTLTHPDLNTLDDYMIERQIVGDIVNLEHLFKKRINGLALPGGTNDPRIPGICKKFNIGYVRSSKTDGTFNLPKNRYDISSTAKYTDADIFQLADEFFKLEPDRPLLFSLYGHSYELDYNNSWDRIEEFFKFISNREDVFYGSNYETYYPFL